MAVPAGRRSVRRIEPHTLITLGVILIAGVPLGLLAAATGPIISTKYGLDIRGGLAPWVTLIAAVLLIAPTVLVWRTRWNVLAVTQLGLIVAAYLVPLLFVHTLSQWPATTVHMYVGILVLGAVGTSIGVVSGNALGSHWARAHAWLAGRLDALTDATAVRRIWIVGIASAMFLAGCFAAMGYIPLLTGDPTSAKYLNGAYTISRKVAFAYHLAVPAASLAVVLVLGAAWRTRRTRFYWLSIALLLLLLGTDQRAYASTGILVILLLGSAARRIPWWPVALIVLVLTPLGSASGFLLSNDLGYQQFGRPNQGTNLSTAIANGATDIPDSLKVLQNYLVAPQPTHGRTFYSALAYSGGQWVPNAWSLREANPGVVDLSKIQSGGLRFPSALWGYYAWGWLGVIVTTLASGLLVGLLIGVVRMFIGRGSFLQSVVLAGVLLSAGVWLQGFYLTSWLYIAACLPVLAVLVGRGRVLRRL